MRLYMESVARFARRMTAFTLIEMLIVIAIIAVLAALLLSALTSAREKSRRASCINNLSQLARALESYAMQQGQYYPSTHNYGIDPNGISPDGTQSVGTYYEMIEGLGTRPVNACGVFRDDYVSTGTYEVGRSFAAPSLFRTIFFGDDINTSGLHTAPQGLGFLMTSGYQADARLYLCPSADNMRADWSAGQIDFGKGGAYTRLAQISTLGGFDAKSMTQGAWKLTWYDHAGAQSSYNYRNVPITSGDTTDGNPVAGGPPHSLIVDYTTGGAGTSEVLFDNVKPRLISNVGAPQFKTQKLLGARALVSDTFSKCENDITVAGMSDRNATGMGRYAHKVGYNVLYGDGHVKWLGDPEKNIMYWNALDTNPEDNYIENSASVATISRILTRTDGSEAYAAEINGMEGFRLWHMFDVQGEVDNF